MAPFSARVDNRRTTWSVGSPSWRTTRRATASAPPSAAGCACRQAQPAADGGADAVARRVVRQEGLPTDHVVRLLSTRALKGAMHRLPAEDQPSAAAPTAAELPLTAG